MLHRTAAADAEMPAGGIDPQQRRRQDRNQFAPVFDARRRHRFAGQGERYVHRPVRGIGDPVALRAEPADLVTIAHRLFIPARRNSRLPSPPAIGEGCRPIARQPGIASSQSRSLAAISSASCGRFNMPPLPIASRPASNCGLTRTMARAPGAASSRAGGKARVSEMKLTSQTRKSGTRRQDRPPTDAAHSALRYRSRADRH